MCLSEMGRCVGAGKSSGTKHLELPGKKKCLNTVAFKPRCKILLWRVAENQEVREMNAMCRLLFIAGLGYVKP
jgi:hypothetical protein